MALFAMRRLHRTIGCALVAAIVAVGIAACGGTGESGGQASKAPDYDRALAGAPKPLADLYAQGDRLLPGGTAAFERRLAALRGHPVVVNKWASWCGPCREELPFFQRLSAQMGKRVAFVGVDGNDSPAAARTFLGEFPLPYPSYTDPDESIAGLLGATVGFPATAFYDAAGTRVFVKQGQYATQADLAADIRRYALRG
jgi:cytochrome c biogenesis protein CcmG/thiol:disulfide interchange protein DsbE